MAYKPNIPQPGDRPSASQSDFLENFTQLNNQFAIDHIAWDAGANNGKHSKSTYVEQSVDPATAANELDLYSKEASGATELFWRRESNGTVLQMTSGVPITGGGGFGVNGQMFLPGGIRIKWGRSAITTGGTTVTFASVGLTPFPNTIYTLTANPVGKFAIIRFNHYDVASFNLSADTNSDVFWFAIGR